MNTKLPKNKVGRPKISDLSAYLIFQKLQPYLVRGLSLHKSCISAGIPKSTAYLLYKNNDEFMENVERAKMFIELMIRDYNYRRLVDIHERITKGEKISKQDDKFVEWLALHEPSCADMFGSRTVVFEVTQLPESVEQENLILHDKKAVLTLLETSAVLYEKLKERSPKLLPQAV
jgi:hypothetical protein